MRKISSDTEPCENQVYTAIFSSLIFIQQLSQNILIVYSQGASALQFTVYRIFSSIYLNCNLVIYGLVQPIVFMCISVYTLEANILGVLCIGLRLHANWGTDDEIWKVKCVDEFLRHKPHLVTEVVCQLMNSLRT